MPKLAESRFSRAVRRGLVAVALRSHTAPSVEGSSAALEQRRRGRWLLPALFAPLLGALTLAGADCKPSSDPPEPCTEFPPRCEEGKLVVCQNEAVARLDCAQEGLDCLLDSKGEGTCAKRCPPTLDKYGACQGANLLTCDGKALRELACDEQGMLCGYMIEGYATCTKPCPPFIDGRGACTGPGMRRCNGQVFFDLNCSDLKQFCETTTDGTAECGDLCPPGLDTFGVCEGAVSKRCDGALYKEEDCGKAGKECVQLDRFGVGCRGCPTASTVGACSATGQITGCTTSGEELHESCVARGGTCGFSDAECRNTCLDPKPQVACDSEELAEGQKKCKENPVTHFWSIITCKDGRVVESECPAASDGTVTCAEVDGGAPRCQTTCGLYGRRCTDRGVLIACTTAGLSWIDCAELGAKCMDNGTDAFCACSEVPEHAARCSADKHGWSAGYADAGLEEGGAGFVIDAGAAGDAGDAGADGGHEGPPLQYTCSGGRLDVAACACEKP